MEDNKPLGVFGTVQMGLRLWMSHALDATIIAMLINVPGFMLRQYLYSGYGLDPTKPGEGTAYGYISIVEYPLYFWGCLALALIFAAGYCGERATAAQALNRARIRFIPFSLALFGPSIIMGVLMAPLLLLAGSVGGLLGLPLSILAVGIALFTVCLLFILAPIAAVEEIGPVACMMRAFDETKRNFGYLLSVFLAFSFCTFMIMLVIMMLFFGDTATIDETGAIKSVNIPSMFFLTMIMMMILLPWSMATSVAAYVSLRQRRNPEYTLDNLRTEIGLN